MAKTVQISEKENIVKIVIDGNEIHDVISYATESNADAVTTITLQIAVLTSLEVQIE